MGVPVDDGSDIVVISDPFSQSAAVAMACSLATLPPGKKFNESRRSVSAKKSFTCLSKAKQTLTAQGTRKKAKSSAKLTLNELNTKLASIAFYSNGGRKGGKDYRRFIVHENNHIFCVACKSRISAPRKILQHCEAKSHERKAAIFDDEKVKREKTLMQLGAVTTEVSPQALTDEQRQYRISALLACAKANLSMSSFQELAPWVDQHSKNGLNLGWVKDIPRFWSSSCLDLLVTEIKNVLQNSFKEYGALWDGTPSFAEAEAIVLRGVTHNLDIYELLISVKLFSKKLKGLNLANNLVQTFVGRFNLDLKDWLNSGQDRASTNKLAIKSIKESNEGFLKDANPTRDDCIPHTLNNCGKQLVNRCNAPYAHDFRKKFQSVVQYGKCTILKFM